MMVHNSLNGGGLYSQVKSDAGYEGQRGGVLKILVLIVLTVVVVGVCVAVL